MLSFILQKKSKPKLVDNYIINQISKQNLFKQQNLNIKSEVPEYKILINSIHNKCIIFLTTYFWIIIILLIIIYILWCRYVWYANNKKKCYNSKLYQYRHDNNDLDLIDTSYINNTINTSYINNNNNTIDTSYINNNNTIDTSYINNNNNTIDTSYTNTIDTLYTNKKDNKDKNMNPINTNMNPNLINDSFYEPFSKNTNNYFLL